jgi:antibiotic biosynthesis monooxygenase (ABM) superfamily enzyme
MNVSSSDQHRPVLEVRGARASAVIVQRVPVEKVDRFLELQHGIAEAARGFPGYQKVDIYPPAEPERTEWVVIIHFDDEQTLQRWLDAPARAEWIARFHNEIGEFRLKKLPSGFSAWFTGQVRDDTLPPSWKIALAVLLPLYPTVMVLTILDLPSASRFGLSVARLLGNALSIAILQWAVTPYLNVLLTPWLRAKGREGRRVTLVGLVLILAALGGMTVLFRAIAG